MPHLSVFFSIFFVVHTEQHIDAAKVKPKSHWHFIQTSSDHVAPPSPYPATPPSQWCLVRPRSSALPVRPLLVAANFLLLPSPYERPCWPRPTMWGHCHELQHGVVRITWVYVFPSWSSFVFFTSDEFTLHLITGIVVYFFGVMTPSHFS
jgi:hypothetical protein